MVSVGSRHLRTVSFGYDARSSLRPLENRAVPVSLCLDFGTAYSKASAWTTDTNRPIPLQIGKTIGYAGFAIPTKVAVTNNGFVYFGEEADNKDRGRTRVLGDLKR